MLTLPPSVHIYLAAGVVDMRRGHDGLFAVVRNQWQLDPFAGHLFVFVGRRNDRCKILFWDRGGFVLYYKRLDEGTFRVPEPTGEGSSVVVEIDERALDDLLDGIDVDKPPRSAKRRRTKRTVH